MYDDETLGKLAYDAYCDAVGGLSIRGETLPDWDHQGERQKIGWRAAGRAVHEKTHGSELQDPREVHGVDV